MTEVKGLLLFISCKEYEVYLGQNERYKNSFMIKPPLKLLSSQIFTDIVILYNDPWGLCDEDLLPLNQSLICHNPRLCIDLRTPSVPF